MKPPVTTSKAQARLSKKAVSVPIRKKPTRAILTSQKTGTVTAKNKKVKLTVRSQKVSIPEKLVKIYPTTDDRAFVVPIRVAASVPENLHSISDLGRHTYASMSAPEHSAQRRYGFQIIKTVFSVGLSVLLVFSVVHAAGLANPYFPGESLDPDCAPGETNCTVASPITSIGPIGQGQTGMTQTLATSSDTNLGLIITSSGGTHTFAPQWSGTLGVSRGGTGASSFTANALLSFDGTSFVSTTSPTFSALTVTSTTATSTFSTGGLTVGENRFVILQNGGNVGMGTAAPIAQLQILGSSALNTVQALNVGGSNGTGLVVTNAGNVGIGTTSPDTRLVVQAGTQNGTVALVVSDSTGTQRFKVHDNGQIYATGKLTLTTGNVWDIIPSATALTFTNVSSGITPATFTSSGNVGIGTTGPTSPLHVYADKSAGPVGNTVVGSISKLTGAYGGSSIFRVGDENTTADLEVNSTFTATGVRYGTYKDLNLVNNYTLAAGAFGNINFVTNGAIGMTLGGGTQAGQVGIGYTTLGTAKLAINGNVGIGTTSPSQLLTVGNNNQFTVTSGGLVNSGPIEIDHTGAQGGAALILKRTDYVTPNGAIRTMGSGGAYGWGIGQAFNITSSKIEFLNGASTVLAVLGNGLFSPFGAGQVNTAPAMKQSATTLAFRLADDSADAPISAGAAIFSGNVGIGTTSPGQKLTVAGSMGLPMLATDATGYYVCLNTVTGALATSTTACGASSIRYKENIQELSATRGLDTVMSMKPVTFSYRPETKVIGSQIGFIAEDIFLLVPEAVGIDSFGLPSNVDYGKLTPIIVKAIQQMNLKVDSLAATTTSEAENDTPFTSNLFKNIFARVGAWLAQASNGLTSVFADVFHARRQICVDDQCLNADDVRSLLTLARSQNNSGTDVAQSATGEPESPISLVIIGNNPAVISVGDSYSDLGAVIATSSPESDRNLSVFASVDGNATTTVDSILIDTSTAGVHVILYSVTNSAGVTASAERQVIVGEIVEIVSAEDIGGDSSSELEENVIGAEATSTSETNSVAGENEATTTPVLSSNL